MKYYIVYIDAPKNRYSWLGYGSEQNFPWGNWIDNSTHGKARRFPTVEAAVENIKKNKWMHVFITAANLPRNKRVERTWFRANGEPCSWKRVRACRW
jgi:hypothetical protein